MQVGALTAYLAYLMQIVMSVMMATFMMMMIPRVGGLRRPDHGGARHRHLGAAPSADDAVTVAARARHARARRGRVQLPRRRRARPPRPLVPGGARPDGGRRRLHRRRQEHPGQPGAPALRRRPPARSGSPGSTYADSRPSSCGRGSGWCRRRRSSSAAPCAPTSCTEAGRHRRGAVAGPGDRPGRRLRPRDARGSRRPDRPGRHQRQRRPASAARHRARRRTPSRPLPVRRLLLRARPGHRRPAAGRAARRSPATRRC